MAKGKTSQYYANNPDAAAKHRAYQRKLNKKPEQIAYRSKLNKARRKRGIYGKGGGDLSHSPSGQLRIQKPSTNRAANGHGNNSRYA